MAAMTGEFVCEVCDEAYAADPGVCGRCGGDRFRSSRETQAVPPADTTAPQAPTAAVPSEFVICSRSDCGQPVPVTNSVCDYCGTALELVPPASAPARSTERNTAELIAPDGTRVPLQDGVPVTFGRNPDHSPWARLAEGNMQVSGRHAEIVTAAGTLHVRDLGSTNGTWVRGIRIDGAAAVPLEDGITIGLSRRLELVVRLA